MRIKQLVQLAIALAIVGGCSSADVEKVTDRAGRKTVEKAAEEAAKQAGADVDVSSKIPDSFPKEFPLPSGAEAVFSTTAGNEGGMVVYFSAPKDADLKGFFEKELPARGWTISNNRSFALAGVNATVMQISGHGFEGALTLGKVPGAAFAGDFSFGVTLTKQD